MFSSFLPDDPVLSGLLLHSTLVESQVDRSKGGIVMRKVYTIKSPTTQILIQVASPGSLSLRKKRDLEYIEFKLKQLADVLDGAFQLQCDGTYLSAHGFRRNRGTMMSESKRAIFSQAMSQALRALKSNEEAESATFLDYYKEVIDDGQEEI